MGTGRCSRLAPYRPALHFHCATGLFVSPKDSRACCTPWSVFQDGSDEATYSQQSEAQSRRSCAAKETPTAHYRSSPRRRPPPRRETSGHEGLRCWVERPSPRSPARSGRRGYTPLASPLEAGEGTTRPPFGTAGNPRWPAPRRNTDSTVGGASAGRTPTDESLPPRPEPHTERRLATYASLLTVSRSL